VFSFVSNHVGCLGSLVVLAILTTVLLLVLGGLTLVPDGRPVRGSPPLRGDHLVVAIAAARAGLHVEKARLYTERSAIAETLRQSLLPAALTGLTRHTLYAAALRERSPARNLAFLDEAMRRRTRTAASFSTVLYARVCPGADATAPTLVSGGHPRPLILTAEGDGPAD
jgi:hypothetical protein